MRLSATATEPCRVTTEVSAFDGMEGCDASPGDAELGEVAAEVPGFLPPGAAAAHVVVIDGVHETVAVGCFPVAALTNHSCHPSCAPCHQPTTAAQNGSIPLAALRALSVHS
jgi:hypothetical protein